MSESREKQLHFLLRVRGKNITVEAYQATDWPKQKGANPGCYRLRQDGRWVRGVKGERFCFFSEAQLGAYLVALASGGEPTCPTPPPKLPERTEVRWQAGTDDNGKPLYARRHTLTEPWQGIDGRWYVHVFGSGQRTVMAVEDLKVIE